MATAAALSHAREDRPLLRALKENGLTVAHHKQRGLHDRLSVSLDLAKRPSSAWVQCRLFISWPLKFRLTASIFYL